MTHLIRNVEIEGRAGLDVRLDAGVIAEIGVGLRGGDEIDGQGGALIPGLCDHHIHLFGLAASADSVALDQVAATAAVRPPGAWIRVLGYHESQGGDLTRADLDRLAPRHRLRVQHQTGSLWILNSLALDALGVGDDPPGLERDTGRLWRGDAWLRGRIGAEPPPLAPIGARLAAYGITALTDASVTTDASAADRLAAAHRAGDLPQRLMLMSGGPLAAPADGAFAVGPLKVLLDDHSLPDFDDFTGRIAAARAQGRAVAVHCVTAAELALTLAVFEAAGSRPGDRIEHGSVIPPDAVTALKRLNLTVVTQPAFIHERGDRYAAEVAAQDQPDLYRCRSLLDAGVPVAASSDAPYASADPWAGMAAAVHRTSRGGRVLAAGERIAPARALDLYVDDPSAPGRAPRRIATGAPADLCLLDAPLAHVLDTPGAGHVRATFIAGRRVHG
ncbi:MAG: amidohydrolase family protein [Alphaproteobacteria bacterium]|nr:amidohydrolase family protein [Alphaproteobacteria bacterium]MBU1514319.1 amidohydrolase family protein [Alphaproteobacteria bacterium]MBU2095963.1 amidohydrolase family protein [Alphaproteobacteria bacterium]MBU2153061.1 amidohydrolase family protein [Alphaproteobacteria bacterium]MBU2308518.1 amidohydrolase family protein [Alphaproteobacteria bacterium]